MDVLVGSSSAATASCLFLNQNGAGGGGSGGGAFGGGRNKALSDDSLSSTSSSSIGAPDVSDEENDSKDGPGDVTDGEEVQSKFTGGGGGKMSSLGSLGSLEDSLPIKRGLSNYFSGKSKSFQSLSDVVTTASTVKELEKRDNPFNKRRRVLIASKWSRKSSSFYTMPNPKSMPLLTLNENEHEDEDDQEPEETQEDPSSDQSSSDEKEDRHIMIRTPKLLDRGLKSFKSRSCYCLSDLQEHEH